MANNLLTDNFFARAEENEMNIFCKLVFTTSVSLAISSLAFAEPVQLETQLAISDAIVDDFTGTSMEIEGVNFDNGSYVLVALGSKHLTVLSRDSELIEVELPPDIETGSYVLVVSTGPNASQFGVYEVAIGEVELTNEDSPDKLVCNGGGCTEEFFNACDGVFRWIGPCLFRLTSVKYLCTCCNK